MAKDICTLLHTQWIWDRDLRKDINIYFFYKKGNKFSIVNRYLFSLSLFVFWVFNMNQASFCACVSYFESYQLKYFSYFLYYFSPPILSPHDDFFITICKYRKWHLHSIALHTKAQFYTFSFSHPVFARKKKLSNFLSFSRIALNYAA